MPTLTAEIDQDNPEIITLASQWIHKDQIALIPGTRWSAAHRRWTIPLSWAACTQLRAMFGTELAVGPQLREWAAGERLNRIDPALARRGELKLQTTGTMVWSAIRSWPGTGKYDLFPHQEAGVDFLYHARDALLTDEMGTGKSATLLSTIRAMDALGLDPYPVLIIAPNSVKQHWVTQVDLWLPGAQAVALAGSLLKKRKQLAAALEHPKAVVILNVEAVRTMSRLAPYGSVRLARCKPCGGGGADPLNEDAKEVPESRCEAHPKELNHAGFRTCVLDEAHRVKDPKAKTTRAIWSVFHNATVTRRYAMTGTPIANHPGDLWSIMHAVAPADFQRRSKFIERYAQISWNGYGMEILGLRPDNSGELFRFLDPRMRRVTKAQVLPDLPPRIYTTREVEMTPAQARIYKQLEANAFAELDGGELVAPNNLALQTRLLQLASSSCDIAPDPDKPDDYAAWVVTPKEPSSKIDELISIITELDGAPVAVAAEHRRLLDLVEARLTRERIPFVSITGAVDELQRATNLARFQAGDVPVILFTMKAGGVGLDMTRAGTLVRLQRSWSLVDNLQALDRVHRIGSEQHSSIQIIDIVAADTIEHRQLETLGGKKERMDEITRD